MLRSISEMEDATPAEARAGEPGSTGEVPTPGEPAPPIESRFLFVDVAALRAKQLRRGARPRLGDDPPTAVHKAERVAMEEVRRGLVYYNVPQPKSKGGMSGATHEGDEAGA